MTKTKWCSKAYHNVARADKAYKVRTSKIVLDLSQDLVKILKRTFALPYFWKLDHLLFLELIRLIFGAFSSAKVQNSAREFSPGLHHKIFSQLIQCFIRDAPLTFGPPLAHYISSSLALFSFWWKMRVNDKRDSIFTLGSKMHFMSPLALWVSFSLLIFQSPWDHPYITSAKKDWVGRWF